MNIYVGVGGYGCECISKINKKEYDILILIDSDLQSLGQEVKDKTIIKMLIEKDDKLNDIYDLILNNLYSALSNITMKVNELVTIKVFSTMCGKFCLNHSLEIGQHLFNIVKKNMNCQLFYVFLPVVNIGNIEPYLENRFLGFVEKCNNQFKDFLLETENVKSFIIETSDSMPYIHKNTVFISEVLDILEKIDTEEYNYNNAIFWEPDGIYINFVQTLKNWIFKGPEKYKKPNNAIPANIRESIETIPQTVTDESINEELYDTGYAFISYSSKKKQSADSIRDLFNRNGIDTWMAPYDIPPGSKYASVITPAIRNCSCFVLLLTNESQNSEAVDSEVEMAVNLYKKSIITIQLEDVVLNDAFTYYIHNKQIIALQQLDESSPQIKKVIDAVTALTGVSNNKKIYEKSIDYLISDVSINKKDEFFNLSSEFLSFLSNITSIEAFDGVPTKVRNYCISIKLLFKGGEPPLELANSMETIFQLVKERKNIDNENLIKDWSAQFLKESRILRKEIAKITGVL